MMSDASKFRNRPDFKCAKIQIELICKIRSLAINDLYIAIASTHSTQNFENKLILTFHLKLKVQSKVVIWT